MTREEIIAANPIVDFVRSRGHELKRAGQNFVTNALPADTAQTRTPSGDDLPRKQQLVCHDCKLGGTVIDWVMHERGCDAAQAMRELTVAITARLRS